MIGADKYYDLVVVGQGEGIFKLVDGARYKKGNFIFEIGSHARGKTFRAYIVGDDFNKDTCFYSYNSKLEIYGIIGGQSGWTERYGWLVDEPIFHKRFDGIMAELENIKEERRLRRETAKAKANRTGAEWEREKITMYKSLLEVQDEDIR
jgi:hypothetical protein